MPPGPQPKDPGTSADRRPYLLALLVLAGLYVLTGRLGLSLAHYQSNATLFWAPTGLSLAALVLGGRRLWPGVFLGSLITNLSLPGTPWFSGLGIAVGNTGEAVVGAWLLQRTVGFRPTFERLQDVAGFVLFGALTCTMVSATVGVSSLWLGGLVEPGGFGLVWLIWWLGDIGGALVVAPLLMLGVHGSPAWGRLARSPETWLVAAGVVASGLVAFGGIATGPYTLLTAFLPIPFLAWAGSRLGSRGTVLASAGTWLFAIWGTQQAQGPFVGEGAHTNLMLLWAYGTTLGAAALMLAAAVGQCESTQRLRDREVSERFDMVKRMNQVQRLEGMGLLAGGVAHDFNNILVTIRGNAELLTDALPSEREEKAHRIVAATDRAADLCKRLMAYAGKETPIKEPVALQTLVDETQELLHGSIPAGVEVVTDERHPDAVVLGEETLLRQVVMNLVLNAVESLGDPDDPDDPNDLWGRGGRVVLATGRVNLKESALRRMLGAGNAKPGLHAFFSVTDDGSGIEPDVLERMFDPFFSTKFDGRGLGLSSVLGILQSHGGAIEVDTEPGRGTRMVAYLPLSASGAAEDGHTLTPHAPATPGRRILVVDDEIEVRRVVAMILESADFEVTAVADGTSALELCAQEAERFDAALLDVTMPGLSGVETREGLLELRPDLPIVLMSGYQALGAVELVGEDAFLRKPFSNRELVERMSLAAADGASRAPADAPQPAG